MIVKFVKISAFITAFSLVVGATAYMTLTLIIKSEDRVVVPELVNKDVVEALRILTGLGLNTKVKGSEFSSSVPKNRVLSQEPAPGTEIKKSRDVRVVISKGMQKIPLPNVTGLTVRQAQIILEENDLHRGTTSFTYSDTVEKGHIISMFPSSGLRVRPENPVDLLVSSGRRPGTFAMPDLVGRPMDEAVRLIEAANLQMGDIRLFYRKNKPLGVILKHDPPYGYPVTEHHPVHLVVNRKQGVRPKTPLTAPRGVGLFSYRTTSGYLKKHIRARVDMFGISFDLYDEFVAPGEEIWIMIPRDHEATIFLYEDEEIVETRTFEPWHNPDQEFSEMSS